MITQQEMEVNCAKARELMSRSRSEHFAVGAFNIDNQDTLIAICNAAKKLSLISHSPRRRERHFT